MKVMVHYRTAGMISDKPTLADSGATDNFIDPEFIKKLKVTTLQMEKQRLVTNIDGTKNSAGAIKEYMDLEVRTGKETKIMRFLVTCLGGEHLVLGYPWHVAFEPSSGGGMEQSKTGTYQSSLGPSIGETCAIERELPSGD